MAPNALRSGLLALLSLVAWALIVLFPLAALLARLQAGAPLWDAEIRSYVFATAWQASWSTLFSVAIGVPLGLLFGRDRTSRQVDQWIKILLALPFGVPTVVAGTAWVLWLGRNGVLARWVIPLDWAYSFKAVVVAHVFFNAPWVALLVAQARGALPRDRLEAAAGLGAGALARFRWITWPQIRWALLAGAAQVFSLCVMSFALVLILGGGPPVQTLEVAIYSKIRFAELDLDGAAVCAFWELVLCLAPWLVVLGARAREKRQGIEHWDVGSRRETTATGGALSQVGLLFLAALWLVPYAAVLDGLVAGGPALWNAPEFVPALIVSFQIALLSASLALALAIAVVAGAEFFSATKAVFFAVMTAPSGISALVLGLGFWLFYREYIDPYSGSLLAIVAIQAALFYPVAIRILWPVAERSPRLLKEAAATLGASPWSIFLTVEWPRWKAPLIISFGMILAASLGEVAVVSLFYSEKLVPLSLLLSRWAGQYRFEEAQALAALLFLLSCVTMGAVLWWGQSDERGA